MKVLRGFCLMLVFLAAIAFQPSVQAGTNDLFPAKATWKCNGSRTRLRLANSELINVALGNSLDAAAPDNVQLGLQFNCSTLKMTLVIYDAATKETVGALADIETVTYHANAKTAVVIGSGTIRSNEYFVAGSFSARMVVRLDADACLHRARITASGEIQIDTEQGAQNLSLRGKIQTVSPQIRPVEATGSGNYGSGAVLLVLDHPPMPGTNIVFGTTDYNLTTNLLVLINGFVPGLVETVP